MKSWKTIRTWLTGGCVCYTLLSVFFLFLGTVLNGTGFRINTLSFLLMLPCGMLISAANLLLRWKRLAFWLRSLLHYTVTVLSVFLFLWLPANTDAHGSTMLILAVAFSAVYWILFGLVHLFLHRMKRLMSDD